jgi:hypothetical protein
LPTSPSPTCWIRNIPGSCTTDQRNKILNDQGVIINGVLYNSAADWSSAMGASSMVSGSSGMMMPTGSVTTVTQVLTGFYTATATPTNIASTKHVHGPLLWSLFGAAILPLV